MKKRILSLIMALVICFGIITPTYASPASASQWAREDIARAISLGLVPQSLQSNYTTATHRIDFAILAVALYEAVHGEITGRVQFSDTNDINAQKLAYIGVYSDLGTGTFGSFMVINREEAAVMLSRLATAVRRRSLPSSAPTFADNANIISFARDAVGQMQAAGIMGGDQNNNFNPQQTITREQSIVTLLRLYDLVTSVRPGVEINDSWAALREPFAYTTSEIRLPNRRLTDAERQEWINEYWAMGGASAFEMEVIRLVNVERVAHGLTLVVPCDILMLSARFHAQTLANLGYVWEDHHIHGIEVIAHHFGPYGGSRHSNSAFGGPGTGGNGNFAWTPEQIIQGWLSSPGHRAFMLHPDARIVGFGSQVGDDADRVFHYLPLAIATPGTPEFVRAVAELEAQILQHINDARTSNGLRPLQLIDRPNNMRSASRGSTTFDLAGTRAFEHSLSRNAQVTHINIRPVFSGALVSNPGLAFSFNTYR